MKKLSLEEERWLKIFAKSNLFFEDLLRDYLKNGFLTEKQYEHLEMDIDIAKDDGKNTLTKTDYMFLIKYAEEDKELREILETYDLDGFLDDFDFNIFIDRKLKLNPEVKKKEPSSTKMKNNISKEEKIKK